VNGGLEKELTKKKKLRIILVVFAQVDGGLGGRFLGLGLHFSDD
jgi:hypothetical protein